VAGGGKGGYVALQARGGKPMRTILVLLWAAMLTACSSTPIVWSKAEATPETARADLIDCRQLALDEMWRLGWERSWPPRFYDPRFMPPYYRSMRPFWLDFPLSLERESALVDFCMHSKGYRRSGLQ
jgi:hypothetical protein